MELSQHLSGKIIGLAKESFRAKEIKDDSSFVDVKMNTFGITKADRENPVLKTIGVGPCVAVTMYDPETKVAGMVHMTAPAFAPKWEGPNQDIVNTLNAMQRNGTSERSRGNIQAHVIGGWENDELPELVIERLEQLGVTN